MTYRHPEGTTFMTLLAIRKAQLAHELEDLDAFYAQLRAVVAAPSSANELAHTASTVAMYATRVARLSTCVEDLDDVHRYGPHGGRATPAPRKDSEGT